jgi:tryptophan synthase alpha chain
VPVVLGFGISSAETAVEAATEADGLIIGSKLMQLAAEGGPEGAARWLREVREALDSEAHARVGSRD